MAVTVQMQFESAVTERYQDAFVGSSIDNGATIITCALRKLDFQRALGTTATIGWRQAPYHVDLHELSTFHKPIKYRFLVAQGSSLNAQNQRVSFTPDIQGGSTAQPMSHSVIRLACDLAVVCGVSLRHLALLFSGLFLIPMSTSSMKRWMDDVGVHVPTPEEMLRQLLALAPATECHIDGYDPLGTEHCVMVVKDAHGRILLTHEAASEHGEAARQFLQRCQDRGLQVTAAFSDDSQSFTEAITAVFPHARFQADHFHTVKPIWGHRKKSLRSYRRQVKASGAEKNDEQRMAVAKKFWA
jgi:transposase